MIFIGSSKGLLDLGGPVLTRFETFSQLVFFIFSSKSGPKRGFRPISIPPRVGDIANNCLDLTQIFDPFRLNSIQISASQIPPRSDPILGPFLV